MDKNFNLINKVRMWHLAIGEWVDAWRVIPRVIVAGYAYILYRVVEWYMTLEPYVIEKCTSSVVADCIVQAPTTQHTALVTAVVSMAAVVFGFYVNGGRKWSEGVKLWPFGSKSSEKDAEPNDSASK